MLTVRKSGTARAPLSYGVFSDFDIMIRARFFPHFWPHTLRAHRSDHVIACWAMASTRLASVAVDGGLHVRAYNGVNSRWHEAAMRQKAGRILAAGLTKEVAFARVEGPTQDRIDEAYRAKYRGSPYLAPMVGARARAATVRITPADV